MAERSRVSVRRVPMALCARCGSALPAAAATGRPRVFCSPACRKAAYEDRRARKPEAFQIRVVEHIIERTIETISTIDEGHDLPECVRRAAASPRAVTNILVVLAGMARTGILQHDPRWAPAVRAIADLNRALIHAQNQAGRRPGR